MNNIQTSGQHSQQQNQTIECCLMPIFSKGYIETKAHDRNSHGLINPFNKIQKSPEIKQVAYKHEKLKTQDLGGKRSISALKIKRRITNRSTFEIPMQGQKIEGNISKLVNTSNVVETLQRFYSPKAQLNSSVKTSLFETRRRVQNQNRSAIQLNETTSQQDQRRNLFFYSQRLAENIQFSKSGSPPTYPFNSQISKKKVQLQQHVSKSQIIQKIKIPQRINFTSHQHVNVKNPQNAVFEKENIEVNSLGQRQVSKKQILRLKDPQLPNIDQASRQQSRKEQLQQPINQFQHIQSYILQIKGPFKNNEGPNQFDSIKTKGRPVESMMYLSKDLAKTKKPKRKAKKQNQLGLRQLQNITVTSQYDQKSQTDRVQRMQESAVMMNFFNPPTYLRNKLQLSRSRQAGPY